MIIFETFILQPQYYAGVLTECLKKKIHTQVKHYLQCLFVMFRHDFLFQNLDRL